MHYLEMQRRFLPKCQYHACDVLLRNCKKSILWRLKKSSASIVTILYYSNILCDCNLCFYCLHCCHQYGLVPTRLRKMHHWFYLWQPSHLHSLVEEKIQIRARSSFYLVDVGMLGLAKQSTIGIHKKSQPGLSYMISFK